MAVDVKGFSRMLLECNSNDKLCVVREYQMEVIIVPVLLVGFFVIVLTVILWLHCRGLRAKHVQSAPARAQVTKKNQEELCSTENCYIQLSERTLESLLNSASLTLKELEIPREKLLPDTLQLIKVGAFGSIYRAQLETGSSGKTKTVVLKALQDPASPQKVKDFLGRIKFHHNLGHHENLAELVGCCIDQLPLYMIMEDVSLGDLLTFLWTCRKNVMAMDGVPYDLTERQVYEVGQQVVAALAYLEEKNLFHGDIAARNVLLHHNFTAKLCGLGLAYETHTRGASSDTWKVPIKWQAPERLLRKPPTIKADIWSFGILLYEMITLGAPPYPEVPPSDILPYLQKQNIMKQPSSCQQAMYCIMKSCWQWTAAHRPSPAHLLCSLKTAMKTSNGHTVLQVPEPVVPELYADIAGVDVYSLVREYTIL
ncbi:tyrosine-protein kinase STYK1-like isoform X1 [Poecile atricapillus]|uniref:tyrosine-protein kinase STYK1-like isoform X1 n=1 Tax=Poecile atricapillus TaxID=48891 RepID=UPI002738A571|nr:tyrosine-protein kinase STYK1-like isoform X1 [Poecile atricapillus]XP_058719134.1 tyrosine-protein kinase STYK1-like isoform X1 [Poecile atricapillus]XP_058719135.1 tyrosine-protein kinase STYK1-like isoform X1 [Poecile atricapillus]XP_058719136.1 tyrosine-protein kinase STYK1-like isoform X1 [Poecile atricapillus]XP_058719137.1 tyrosine-protein kinase STYK1-like isoform X1 [Poecile atricapillus]XP_058719138.1 tyrosine-protein kinase STYK1-like isoform X1 [Poecile atricapillus]XP_05871914